VLNRADLYIIDNSSTAYEFAAAGRPVVLMNAPSYRKDISHGIRFWDYLVGPTVDSPRELLPTVRAVLANPHQYEQQRRDVVKALYPHQGKAAVKAASVIKSFLS
jgi:CDP-glycerol glycerophosphotransferase (TagB/SpsB family)